MTAKSRESTSRSAASPESASTMSTPQRLEHCLQRDAVLAPVVDEQHPRWVDRHHQRCNQTLISDRSCSTSTGLVT